jgi:signal transduction histidine kinase
MKDMVAGLRRQMVIVVGIVLTVVFAAVFGLSEYSVWGEINDTADTITRVIAENGGAFPDGLEYVTDNRLSMETPYESRWFTVTMRNSGESEVDTRNIYSMDEHTARSYAMEALSSVFPTGYTGSFRYRVKEQEGAKLIVFLDRGRQLSSFYAGIASMARTSFFALVIILVTLACMAESIVKPITESYAKQRRFITNAGHDIKTPLTAINADIEMLSYDIGENEWVDDIKAQVAELTTLTNDLIFLAKMQEGRVESNFEMDLSSVVRAKASMFESRIAADGKSYRMSIEDGIPFVGDEKLIAQMVGVLIDNAVKYSTDGGDISVSLTRKGRNAILVVSNTADAAALTHVDRWFDRFYQEDGTRTEGRGGYGIGLSVAQAVAETNGGTIQSKVTGGNTINISVKLPIGANKER